MIAAGVTVAVLAVTGMGYRHFMPATIDPAAYAPLLQTIAKGESNGNYNAYYPHADNTTIRFTEMTVGEVMQWQHEYVKQGSYSSAVGKYQIIRPTLAKLVRELDIDHRTKFDENLQDRLAIALIERRGAQAFVEKKLTREQFAANLAQEWAALPKITTPHPDQSHYAGDGVNKARISIDEIYKAISILES